MNNRTDAEADQIVARFSDWVKDLFSSATQLGDEAGAAALEQRVRDDGREILVQLLQTLLTRAIEGRTEAARTCPHCHGRRRHQGVRSRRLTSSLGVIKLQGVYWKCFDCQQTGHTADLVAGESMSLIMRDLVTMLGAAMSSFAKAQVISQRVLGVPVDEQTIRRRCLSEGRRVMREPICREVEPSGRIIGSCDGTMVNTREDRWREIKAWRFDHDQGSDGGARLERVGRFAQTLRHAAEASGIQQADQVVFVTDAAIWIRDLIGKQFPGRPHVIDIYHARQHVHRAGETIYGQNTTQAAKWSAYWSRRLRRYGAADLVKRLRRFALCYRDLNHQRAVLDLATFLDRHADRMNYPMYEARGWPISSGPMESFCKQLGLRLKGPGMRWNLCNVDPMAALVSRWSMDNWPAFEKAA